MKYKIDDIYVDLSKVSFVGCHVEGNPEGRWGIERNSHFNIFSNGIYSLLQVDETEYKKFLINWRQNKIIYNIENKWVDLTKISTIHSFMKEEGDVIPFDHFCLDIENDRFEIHCSEDEYNNFVDVWLKL